MLFVSFIRLSSYGILAGRFKRQLPSTGLRGCFGGLLVGSARLSKLGDDNGDVPIVVGSFFLLALSWNISATGKYH